MTEWVLELETFEVQLLPTLFHKYSRFKTSYYHFLISPYIQKVIWSFHQLQVYELLSDYALIQGLICVYYCSICLLFLIPILSSVLALLNICLIIQRLVLIYEPPRLTNWLTKWKIISTISIMKISGIIWKGSFVAL